MEETISENELIDAQLEPKHVYPTAVELSTGHFRAVSNTPFSAKNSPTASKAVVPPRPRRVSVLHKVISSMIKRKKRGAAKAKLGVAVAQQNKLERAIDIIDKNIDPDPDQKKSTKEKKSSKAKSSKKNKPLKSSEDKEDIVEGTSKSTRSKSTIIIDHDTKANPLQLKALEKIRFIQELTIPTVADDAISNASAASAAWGDAFSIKTQGTDYSSVSADDISIRTEDIIDKDGTVHNYNYPEIVDESAKEDEDEENNEPKRDEFEIDFQIDPTPISTPKRKKSIEKNENWTIEDRIQQPNEEWEEVVEYETDDAKAGSSRHKQTTTFKNIITKYTYKNFRWNHEYTSLTVKSCVYPITAEQLAQSRGSLVNLKFAQLTSFKNILNFLQNCPNLKKLSFSNIALVQKKSVIENKITLPHVKELEMTEWLMCLTKNEYWLLDYFTQKVNFRKLQSFTFRGTENFVSEKNRRKCTLTLKKITQVSAVAKFLLKNRDTLKKVSLGGVGFKMMEGGEANTYGNVDLSAMHSLQHLRVPLNVSGVDVLLKSQSKLSSLAGCGYINVYTDQMRDMIHGCISKNKHIKAVGIFPCIMSDHSSSVVDRKIIYSFDCEILRNCKKLESLFLNTTLSSRTVTVRNSCGHIFNLQALPLTLVQIEIYNYEFQEADLDMFGKRFSKFVKLKKLILSSDKSRTYSIQLAWLKSLFSLQNFSSADFFGGKMGSPQAFQNFVLSKPKGYMTMVKIADCVSFYKNSQNE